MSAEIVAPLIFILLFALLATGTPLGLAMSGMGVLGSTLIIGADGALALAGISVYEAAQNFELSVIPLFVLMGAIAARSGISADLFAASQRVLARTPGGLGHATIVACAGFGAVCGSSLATAATMGRVALPQMKRFGYSDRLAAGVVAAGGTIGILIPPSVIMLIYGILTETSIGDLFIAGIVPGILLTLLFMATVFVLVNRRPDLAPSVDDLQDDAPHGKVWPAGLLFLLVIGGIYAGFFTPTEAAGIGAAGAVAIGFALRKLTRASLGDALMETVITTSMIFMILIGAILFSGFLSLSGTPAILGGWITGLEFGPLGTILLIVLIYILLGAFLDTMAMIILSIPVFFPIALSMGFDQIWFGILVVVVVELALITPPMGINVFVLRSLSPETKLSEIFLGVLPFCVALVLLIALLIAFPSVATFAL